MYVSACISTAVLSFLLGSIPTGVLLARAFKLPDPRTLGSGNIGATNMLRTGNKKVAALTLVLDALKGTVAVLLADMLWDAPLAIDALAVFFAVLGHAYSPWLKFKGGKGVATLLGGLLALNFALGAVTCLIWLAMFFAMRISSLAALTALAFLPLIALLMQLGGGVALILGLTAILVAYRHRENIRRIIRKEEPKFVLKK